VWAGYFIPYKVRTNCPNFFYYCPKIVPLGSCPVDQICAIFYIGQIGGPNWCAKFGSNFYIGKLAQIFHHKPNDISLNVKIPEIRVKSSPKVPGMSILYNICGLVN